MPSGVISARLSIRSIPQPAIIQLRTMLVLTGGDTHAAADIICYMNGYNDHRRSKYFVPSEWTGYEYVGVRRSINRSTLGADGT